MATKIGIGIEAQVLGDGVTTEFHLDLLTDPYQFPTGPVQNWFADNRKAPSPTAVIAGDLNSYSISGTVVTITTASLIPEGVISGLTFFVAF